MADWDLLLTDARIATMSTAGSYGVIEDGTLGIADGEIAWVGKAADKPGHNVAETRSVGQRWVTPALIDCHTHLVFGGDRAAEYEQRLAGVSYGGPMFIGAIMAWNLTLSTDDPLSGLFDAFTIVLAIAGFFLLVALPRLSSRWIVPRGRKQ